MPNRGAQAAVGAWATGLSFTLHDRSAPPRARIPAVRRSCRHVVATAKYGEYLGDLTAEINSSVGQLQHARGGVIDMMASPSCASRSCLLALTASSHGVNSSRGTLP